MKGFLLFLIVLGGGVAFAYTKYLSPEARHNRDATSLVRHLRMGEMARSGAIGAYKKMQDKGEVTRAYYDCMIGIPVSDYNAVLATLLAKHLSRSEITAATRFYKSPTGDKVHRAVFRMIAKDFPESGLPVESEEPEFDIDDILEINKHRMLTQSSDSPDPMMLLYELAANDEVANLERNQRAKCKAHK